MLTKPQWLFVLSLCLILLSTSVAAEEKKPIVTSDVLKIKTMGQIDISPDGKRVIRDSIRREVNKLNEAVEALSQRVLSRGGRDILETVEDRSA